MHETRRLNERPVRVAAVKYLHGVPDTTPPVRRVHLLQHQRRRVYWGHAVVAVPPIAHVVPVDLVHDELPPGVVLEARGVDRPALVEVALDRVPDGRVRALRRRGRRGANAVRGFAGGRLAGALGSVIHDVEAVCLKRERDVISIFLWCGREENVPIERRLEPRR